MVLAYVPVIIVVGILNLVGIPFVVAAGKIMKHKERSNQTFTKMRLSASLQFMAVCVVMVAFLQKRPDLEVFDPVWYINVSQSLGLVLFSLFAIYYLGVTLRFLWVLLRRWVDRGLMLTFYRYDDPKQWDSVSKKENKQIEDVGSGEKPSISEEESLEQSDEVRTMQKTRKELYNLYTGDEFDAGFTQA
jgi:hypothetical protein